MASLKLAVAISVFLALASHASRAADGQTRVPPPTPAAAHVVPLTVFKSGHIAVPVRIDGKGPFRLVLDTGSPVTFISTRVAKAVGLPAGGPAGGGMMGLGMGMNPFAKVKSLDVGGAVVRSMDIMVLDHPVIQMLGTVEGPVDGIVGFTFFSHFRTTLDYAGRRVTFTPISYQPTDVVQNVFKILMNRSDTRRVIAPAGLWGLALEDGAAGPVVKTVYEGGAAAESGVAAGDRIIALDDRWVASALGLFEQASALKPGAATSLVVERGGKKMTLKITPRVGL